MTDGRRRAAGVLGLVVNLVLVGVALSLNGAVVGEPELSHPDAPRELGYYVVVLSLVGIATVIVWARPRNSVGWLLGLSGTLGVVCQTGSVYGAHAMVVEGSPLPAGAHVLALTAGLWLPALFLPATLLLARYPGGELTSRRALLVDRAVRVAMVSLHVGYSTMPEAVADEVRAGTNPLELPGLVRGPFLAVGGLGLLALTLVVAAMSVRRLLRAGYPERQQLALLVTTSLGAVVLVMASPWEALAIVGFVLLPVSVALGVLRYRLLGIEVVVRRTLLYGALTAAVLLVFVVTASVVSSLVPEGPAPEVLAATVVAVLLAPVRDRLQRGVDRLVYGDRADPWAALGRLGREATGGGALGEVLAAVATGLRLPGAEVRGADGTAASYGDVGDDALLVPLVVADERVGELRVAPRRGERALGAADDRLLSALAPLVALVLRDTVMAEALRVEQERVVQATQAERARLRRDLHDGLGPSLTGVGLGLEAVDTDALPVRSRAVVARLRAEVSASLEEVRRIIDDLRPGALETGDLLTLLRARAAHLSASTPLRVEVVAPAPLPPLAPEVEAAALRIVEEALTNVVRHAGATSCTVTVDATDGLRLEVTDDGVGFTGTRPGGVGVPSMRSRAAALGGRLELHSPGAGTRVVAELPLGAGA